MDGHGWIYRTDLRSRWVKKFYLPFLDLELTDWVKDSDNCTIFDTFLGKFQKKSNSLILDQNDQIEMFVLQSASNVKKHGMFTVIRREK